MNFLVQDFLFHGFDVQQSFLDGVAVAETFSDRSLALWTFLELYAGDVILFFDGHPLVESGYLEHVCAVKQLDEPCTALIFTSKEDCREFILVTYTTQSRALLATQTNTLVFFVTL